MDSLQIYQIKDCSNETITGFFYESELLKAPPIDEVVYEVDKIITEEKRRDGVYSLVTFKNLPKKCKKWVLKKDLVKSS